MVGNTPPLVIGELWMEVRDHKKLARLMVIQEVSHRALARACGFGEKSHSYIGRIVRGEVKNVPVETAARIAATLQVAIDDLFVTRTSSNTGRSGQKKGKAA